MFNRRFIAFTLPALLFLSACGSPAIQDARDVYALVLHQQSEETLGARKFNPELVSLIAHVPSSGNFLFRGNIPIQGNEFSYNDLVAALKKAAKDKQLPEQFYLVDISLINDINPEEAADLRIEQSFWQKNSQKGRLINHPVYGALRSPNDYPEDVRKKLEKIPTLSNTDVLMENIQSLLLASQQTGLPLVLYIHCEAGKDRTGEMAAAYAMKYQGSSYADAYANAMRIAKRDISHFSRNELQWYAYYLKDIQMLPGIGPIK
ncbi:hypothetical protein ACVW0Y_003304 [Pseudomonas sp. TE3786]